MRVLLPFFVLAIPAVAFGQAGQSSNSAARPGDEALTCDQLKAEMQANGLGRQTQAFVQQESAAAALAAQALQAAQAESEDTEQQAAEEGNGRSRGRAEAEPAQDGGEGRRGGGLLRGAGGGLGSPFGGRRDASPAADDDGEEPDSAPDELAAFEARQAQAFGANSPQLERSFRLMELAQAKKCAFLDEGAPPSSRAPR